MSDYKPITVSLKQSRKAKARCRHWGMSYHDANSCPDCKISIQRIVEENHREPDVPWSFIDRWMVKFFVVYFVLTVIGLWMQFK